MADPSGVAAAAPLPTGDYGLAQAALHMGLALCVILAFIFTGFWLLRRFGPRIGLGPGGRGGLLRLAAHLPVGPRRSVIVVRYRDKDLVLGVTDHAITLLTEGNTDHVQTDFADALADRTRQTDTPPGV